MTSTAISSRSAHHSAHHSYQLVMPFPNAHMIPKVGLVPPGLTLAPPSARVHTEPPNVVLSVERGRE
ncbi:hypothetical protein M3J09_007207 [Ascochyta lentis]